MDTHNLRQIDWSNHHGLANTKTGHETASIDSSQTAIVSHEDGDAQNPQEAELASRPDTPDAITDEESTSTYGPH